jgi:hypothetical protein
MANVFDFSLLRSAFFSCVTEIPLMEKCKGEGKFAPAPRHEGTEGEQFCRS